MERGGKKRGVKIEKGEGGGGGRGEERGQKKGKKEKEGEIGEGKERKKGGKEKEEEKRGGGRGEEGERGLWGVCQAGRVGEAKGGGGGVGVIAGGPFIFPWHPENPRVREWKKGQRFGRASGGEGVMTSGVAASLKK